MPRWLVPIVAAVLLTAWVTTGLITGVHPKKEGRVYEMEIDNAFGLTVGADVKLAGVRAGIIDDLELDQHTRRAVVTMRFTRPGFDTLHADAFCQARPQSVIGEYYFDCQPGSRGPALRKNARLPVTRSGSAIGLDLLNSVLRRPYNERLRILIGELGAGVAGRGDDINLALGRALPAVRDLNRVLKTLGDERDRLADIAVQGDRALADLARKRRDASRFVDAAGRAADATAEQEVALGEQFERFPAFLAELAPSMRALGHTADSQAAALASLSADAPALKTLLQRTGTFSQGSRPALTALGKAARTGIQTAKDAKPALTELARSARQTPELAANLRIILAHLDDQDNAVEPDARSPGGKGFSGFQALLNYAFQQSTSINVFDKNSYLLKVNLLQDDECGKYADAAYAKAHPRCNGFIGPNQPGVTSPDPTARQTTRKTARALPRTAGGRTRRVPSPSGPATTGAEPLTSGDLLDFLLAP